MLAVYAFVLCTTLMGTTEATAVWKSAKKKNRPQQQPKEAEHELGVQAGRDCSITQQASTGIYTLSATVGKEMVLFAERPERTARTVPTRAFVEQFDQLFATSPPNAAVTLAGDNNGPLIVVLSQPRFVGDSILEYTITQSESQRDVVSIEQFLDMSGVSCSIFIDYFFSESAVDWVFP